MQITHDNNRLYVHWNIHLTTSFEIVEGCDNESYVYFYDDLYLNEFLESLSSDIELDVYTYDKYEDDVHDNALKLNDVLALDL